MSLGPILPGRLPGSLVTERLRAHLQTANRGLAYVQEQIATGQRFFLPSEAPSAAVRTISLQKLLERKTQSLSNVQTNTAFLNATDGALASMTETLNQAKALIISGTGDQLSSTEKEGLVQEAKTLITAALNAANSNFEGRYLFGGTRASTAPFVQQPDNSVRYAGDRGEIDSFIDLYQLQANNLDGDSAFGGFSPPVTSDVNPGLTTVTRLTDLLGGQGIALGSISVTVEDTTVPVTITRTVDLAGADTIADLQTRLQAAFASDPVTLTVGINAQQNGLLLTPSAATATVAVADLSGGRTAADLGIRSAAAATVTGADLDPLLTLRTTLASLNGGTGVAATAGNGLQITNGNTTTIVDISTAVTVEDLFNLLRSADPNLEASINANGNGLAISTRLSGVAFSIGENGETTAADLGILNLTGATLLSDLNYGTGVPVNAGSPLIIHRRDGTTARVDLAGTTTLQGVIDRINAVDPGNLVASLRTSGRGLQLTDLVGAGALSIEPNAVSEKLGLEGSITPAGPLLGTDVLPSEVGGVFNILVRLQAALEQQDTAELSRLDTLLTQEISNVALARSDVGSRLQVLTQTENRIKDENVRIADSLSQVFDVDAVEAITELSARQFTLEATLKAASQTLQLSLFSYL